MDIDSVGNAYISGSTGGSIGSQSSIGGGDMFYAAYDPNGDQLWVRSHSLHCSGRRGSTPPWAFHADRSAAPWHGVDVAVCGDRRNRRVGETRTDSRLAVPLLVLNA